MVEEAHEIHQTLYGPPKKVRGNSYGAYLARKRKSASQGKQRHQPKKTRIPSHSRNKQNPLKQVPPPNPNPPPRKKPPPPPLPTANKKTPTTSQEKPKPGPPVIPRQKPKPRTRKKRSFLPKKNHEGYPMKQCEFEIVENRWVYRPPGYCSDSVRDWHCSECHLKPCITTKHYDEVVDNIATMKIMRCGTCEPDTDERDAIEILERHRCKVFNIHYVANIRPPDCILRFSKRIANINPEGLMEESSDDDSIFDDFPYRIMRDRQPGDPPTSELLAAFFKKHPEKLRKGYQPKRDHHCLSPPNYSYNSVDCKEEEFEWEG